MTLEELIEDYRDQERKYSEASNQAGNSLQRMKWLGRRIAAQVALAPGAKVYHGPNRIVYAATDDGNLSVIETMRSTASISVATIDDGTYIEDLALAQLWSRHTHTEVL